MNRTSLRPVWLACALLLSLIVGLSGGALSAVAGDNAAQAVINGSVAFAGSATLLVLIINFLSGGRG